MKIAFVTNPMNSTGGVQIFTRDVSKILKERGHEVDIVGLDSLPEKPERGKEEETIGEYFNSLNGRNHYDVVLCNGEFGYKVDHPKAINVFHGSYYGHTKALKEYMSQEDIDQKRITSEKQKISAQGKYVVTVSDYTKSELEESGISVDKFINHSVDTSLFHPLDIEVLDHSLNVGRFQYYRKGFDVLEKLADRGIKIRAFSDAGDAINHLNIDSRPFLDNGLLGREYSQAQVSIIPPRYDAGPLTLLESMACGCPVLTTPVGYGFDMQKIIPEFVVDDIEDIDEFLEKHSEIVRNRGKYSKKALDYFWEFHNPETFKREWISLVEGM